MSVAPMNIGDWLGNLIPTGVYDISMVEKELPKFGFLYEKPNDTLWYGVGRRTILGSRSASEEKVNMAETSEGIFLNSGLADEDRVIGAVELSSAIYRLLFPGLTPPGDKYKARIKAFRANVREIRRGLSN